MGASACVAMPNAARIDATSASLLNQRNCSYGSVMSTSSTPLSCWVSCSYSACGITPSPTTPRRRSGRPGSASAITSPTDRMRADGYSSSGTMKTGTLKVFLIAASALANGSDSGPPRMHGSPSGGTRIAPDSNCGTQLER